MKAAFLLLVFAAGTVRFSRQPARYLDATPQSLWIRFFFRCFEQRHRIPMAMERNRHSRSDQLDIVTEQLGSGRLLHGSGQKCDRLGAEPTGVSVERFRWSRALLQLRKYRLLTLKPAIKQGTGVCLLPMVLPGLLPDRNWTRCNPLETPGTFGFGITMMIRAGPGILMEEIETVPTVSPGQTVYYRVDLTYPAFSGTWTQHSTTLKLVAGGGAYPVGSMTNLKFPLWPEWPEPIY